MHWCQTNEPSGPHFRVNELPLQLFPGTETPSTRPLPQPLRAKPPPSISAFAEEMAPAWRSPVTCRPWHEQGESSGRAACDPVQWQEALAGQAQSLEPSLHGEIGSISREEPAPRDQLAPAPGTALQPVEGWLPGQQCQGGPGTG